MTNTSPAPETPQDFIRDIVSNDVSASKHEQIITRFPPEPNGYLHIGHAKSICLNFGIARDFEGFCHLRMDDTNPTKEEEEYVESIQKDVRWLISGWADHVLRYQPETSKPFYASDYFEKLHGYAIQLIEVGKAYVCDLTAEEVDTYRGAPDQPGKESPYRSRGVEENLDLFARMRAGEFPDGAKTLRAKIDMASSNVWLRDPVIYRIRHAKHHHTQDQWCIYPLYDFAHCLSDSIEGITHSICTLEFEVHRPLYDWILEQLPVREPRPRQIEFARLNLNYTVMSKRKLLQLVKERLVEGWDDPRMPTIAGLRRRGVPPAAIRTFCQRIGVTKYDGVTDVALLEFTLREELNRVANRTLGVLRPLKVVIENYPEGQVEELEAINNPEDPSAGNRKLPFSREIYIEQDDFMEVPPPKFFRLKPGGEVRLRYAYILKCEQVVKNSAGEVCELRCTIDPDSKSGGSTASRKVKGTIHWVSAAHAVDAEVRLYDRLFTVPEPEGDPSGRDFKEFLNPASLQILHGCKLEPSLKDAKPGQAFQFERLGYFCVDSSDSEHPTSEGRPVFNRTVGLRDSWAKEQRKG
ncbi:MAG: glutamine--tRNA ligase/YqeY domain fusion protein [Limisphaerales bacterium]